MKTISRSVIALATVLLVFPGSAVAAGVRDAVVKIFVTSNSMDFYQPWQSKGSRQGIGSGCVIEGDRILTNAHVVTDQTFIQVKKHSSPKKYTAQLLAIGHDCDLALLTVDDESFFEGIVPLSFGGLPQLQDTVSVMGYPTGGDKLSITEGVVSRIEVRSYVHSDRNLLTVQIDAAINSGNSGGPVVQNGQLVGIAMQVASKAQNIGYIIPIPVIDHFFTDLSDGHYDGFPLLGIDFEGTESASLRKFYKIKKKEGGILIAHVLPFSAAKGVLQQGDVVLSIDGVSIGEDGTFSFRDAERLFMSHLITQKQVKETVGVKVVRKARVREFSITLKPYQHFVADPYSYAKPTYYIYGGLVFSVLSMDLLNAMVKMWGQGPFDFVYYSFGSGRLNVDERKEVVVLLRVLPGEINVGYHMYRAAIVDKVNGRKIKSFREFVATLDKSGGNYTVIETAQRSKIILGNANIREETQKILARYGIQSQYSDDVAEWLNKKP